MFPLDQEAAHHLMSKLKVLFFALAAFACEEKEEIKEETVRRRLECQDQEEQTQTQELVVQSQEVQNRKQIQSHRHGLQQRRG